MKNIGNIRIILMKYMNIQKININNNINRKLEIDLKEKI